MTLPNNQPNTVSSSTDYSTLQGATLRQTFGCHELACTSAAPVSKGQNTQLHTQC